MVHFGKKYTSSLFPFFIHSVMIVSYFNFVNMWESVKMFIVMPVTAMFL